MSTEAGSIGAAGKQGPESYALSCIVMDTETTGFRVEEGHRLVEIAAVEIEGGRIVDDGWASLVHPGRPIPVDATRVHGITDAMVKDAPRPEAIGSGLRWRLGTTALCFHNAEFDLPFVRQFFDQAGAPEITNAVVDTLGLARSVYGTGRNSLGELNARLGLPSESAHRALGDARMTARVLILLAGWHERHKGIRTLDELAAYSQDIVRTTNAARGFRR